MNLQSLRESRSRSSEGCCGFLVNCWAHQYFIASGFDTTASNTGVHKAACTILQDLLGRQLLWLACRHHLLELVLKATFQELFGDTTRPEESFFKFLKPQWSTLDLSAITRPQIPDPSEQKCQVSCPSSTAAWSRTTTTSSLETTKESYWSWWSRSLVETSNGRKDISTPFNVLEQIIMHTGCPRQSTQGSMHHPTGCHCVKPRGDDVLMCSAIDQESTAAFTASASTFPQRLKVHVSN